MNRPHSPTKRPWTQKSTPMDILYIYVCVCIRMYWCVQRTYKYGHTHRDRQRVGRRGTGESQTEAVKAAETSTWPSIPTPRAVRRIGAHHSSQCVWLCTRKPSAKAPRRPYRVPCRGSHRYGLKATHRHTHTERKEAAPTDSKAKLTDCMAAVCLSVCLWVSGWATSVKHTRRCICVWNGANNAPQMDGWMVLLTPLPPSLSVCQQVVLHRLAVRSSVICVWPGYQHTHHAKMD